MNSTVFYSLLLCFVSGFTQCLLLGCAIYIFKKHNTFQFQRTFAVVVVMLSIGFFSNFFSVVCSDMPRAQFYESIMLLYDYVVAGFFFIFAISLVYPDKFSRAQLMLFGTPFILAIILYIIIQKDIIYDIVLFVSPLFSLVVTILFEFSIKKHTAMLRDNVGDFERFDLRWSAVVIAVLFFVHLIWSIHGLSKHGWFSDSPIDDFLVFNIIWCFITMAYVLFVTHKVVNLYVFELPPEEEEDTLLQGENKDDLGTTPEYYGVLGNIDIDLQMATHKFFHDPTLTLQKLAIHLGTNRQYLSNYINKEKNKTFYEYINDYRLEEAKDILDNWGDNPQQSLEDVASMSGFNSYSTFFRSFVKKYGETPSKYLKNK